uniref:Abnormal cell migration protein 18-like fibronectin type I domain-containing protein n=1 Tax=Parascaris univalens TaxID=6257 RepID=A0A915BUL0_PARUN
MWRCLRCEVFSALPAMTPLLLLCGFVKIVTIATECVDRGDRFPENSVWIRNEYFNVTCKSGQIKVVNCISDFGTMIPLGSESFWENGIEYSCVDDDNGGSGEEPDACDGRHSEYFSNHFLVSCTSRKIVACVDKNGDIVKEGLFILDNGQLKSCYIYTNGKRARIDNKGCFNGTDYDDVTDESLHIKKYAIWRQGNYDLRCGDQGIHVYRCYLDKGKIMHAGSAWLDSNDAIQVCS